MNKTEQLITIFLIAIAVIFTRFIPFIIFPEDKKLPKIINYLSTVLPYAVMGFLIIYCIKDSIFSKYHSIPELISIIFIIIIYKLKKNTLLSIGAGTVLYMYLVQNIFV